MSEQLAQGCYSVSREDHFNLSNISVTLLGSILSFPLAVLDISP